MGKPCAGRTVRTFRRVLQQEEILVPVVNVVAQRSTNDILLKVRLACQSKV